MATTRDDRMYSLDVRLPVRLLNLVEEDAHVRRVSKGLIVREALEAYFARKEEAKDV